TYLNAVKAAGGTDPDKVMAELRKAKIDDMFTSNGKIRADGLMEHEMYVMQVKKPDESKYPWDYYRLVQRCLATRLSASSPIALVRSQLTNDVLNAAAVLT